MEAAEGTSMAKNLKEEEWNGSRSSCSKYPGSSDYRLG
jgi:hypothetical protein